MRRKKCNRVSSRPERPPESKNGRALADSLECWSYSCGYVHAPTKIINPISDQSGSCSHSIGLVWTKAEWVWHSRNICQNAGQLLNLNLDPCLLIYLPAHPQSHYSSMMWCTCFCDVPKITERPRSDWSGLLFIKRAIYHQGAGLF